MAARRGWSTAWNVLSAEGTLGMWIRWNGVSGTDLTWEEVERVTMLGEWLRIDYMNNTHVLIPTDRIRSVEVHRAALPPDA
jgi:hypothetical protein